MTDSRVSQQSATNSPSSTHSRPLDSGFCHTNTVHSSRTPERPIGPDPTRTVNPQATCKCAESVICKHIRRKLKYKGFSLYKFKVYFHHLFFFLNPPLQKSLIKNSLNAWKEAAFSVSRKYAQLKLKSTSTGSGNTTIYNDPSCVQRINRELQQTESRNLESMRANWHIRYYGKYIGQLHHSFV